LHLDRHNSFALAEMGLAGLIEQARVAKVDLQHMARTTTGTGITSMQLETACREGLLIPYRKQEPEAFKSALELLQTDQGGLVFAPIIGYHEQVGELDFSSMYPSIMRRFNISPETVNCRCCRDEPTARVPEIGHHTCLHRKGLVPRTLAPLLDKRLRYKRLLAAATQPAARGILDQRQTALKWLLVVSFGYLGYKNARFGRIEAHESVTAYSRDLLLQAKEIAERQGYRMLHAIVDSLWLTKPGAVRADYDRLAQAITDQTELSIGVEGLYHWIGFLPSRVNPLMPVPNQFVGLFDHGAMKIRGIEIRRSDAPLLVKRAQAEILRCFSQAYGLAALHEQIPQALEIVRTYRRYLQDGHATFEELAITKSLSKEPQAYRHQTLSMIAAQELLSRGVPLQGGDTIHYIITDANAACPADRVRAVAGLDGTWSYDVSAYDNLLLKAALVLLTPLGVTAALLNESTAGCWKSPPASFSPRSQES
jgi:DNA polymerase-2